MTTSNCSSDDERMIQSCRSRHRSLQGGRVVQDCSGSDRCPPGGVDTLDSATGYFGRNHRDANYVNFDAASAFGIDYEYSNRQQRIGSFGHQQIQQQHQLQTAAGYPNAGEGCRFFTKSPMCGFMYPLVFFTITYLGLLSNSEFYQWATHWSCQ